MNQNCCDDWAFYFDGGGTLEWRKQYEDHLDLCDTCKERLSEASEWDAAVREHAQASETDFRWAPIGLETASSTPLILASDAPRSAWQRVGSLALVASVLCIIAAWQIWRPNLISQSDTSAPKPNVKPTIDSAHDDQIDLDPRPQFVQNESGDESKVLVSAWTAPTPEAVFFRHVSASEFKVDPELSNDDFTFVMLQLPSKSHNTSPDNQTLESSQK